MRAFGYVLATRYLVDNRRKVRFMYREQPDNKDDSGWRFFSGDEDQAYVDDPDHIAIYDIETILGLDRDVEPYLSAPAGSAFEREDTSQGFVLAAPDAPDE